ncbi:MAG TPA: HNH endonuclease [Egibacteraceae bacterium]|nr:HNH endonuclease [Egibacteraceae bacterium]
MDAGPPVLRMRDDSAAVMADWSAGHPHREPPAVAAGGLGGLASGHAHRAERQRRPSPHHKALVLNATMEPLCVVPARRALVLVLNDKADVVQTNGHRYRSERLEYAAPSVVRLRRFVHVPYRRRAALSRRGVFIRDNFTCQYCGRAAENVDHVVPRSRGGPHEWENVVAACRRCNSKKKDLMPAECGMVLRRAPFAPRAAFWLVVAVGGFHDDWQPYLGDSLAAL